MTKVLRRRVQIHGVFLKLPVLLGKVHLVVIHELFCSETNDFVPVLVVLDFNVQLLNQPIKILLTHRSPEWIHSR